MNYRKKGYPRDCKTNMPKSTLNPVVTPYYGRCCGNSPMFPVQPIPGVPVKPVSPVVPVQPIPGVPVKPVPPIVPVKPVPPITPVAPVPVQPAPTIPVPIPAPIPPSPVQTMNVFPVDEGFTKGTIFRGVYIPYKNFQPQVLRPDNEQSRMLHDVDKYYFAAHEMRMYLDSHPEDVEALRLFNEYRVNYVRAKNAYEARWRALDIESDSLKTSPFNWAVTSFPWAGGM